MQISTYSLVKLNASYFILIYGLDVDYVLSDFLMSYHGLLWAL
jgi:hypothetical protein